MKQRGEKGKREGSWEGEASGRGYEGGSYVKEKERKSRIIVEGKESKGGRVKRRERRDGEGRDDEEGKK